MIAVRTSTFVRRVVPFGVGYAFCLNAHVGYRSGTGLGSYAPTVGPVLYVSRISFFLSSLHRVISASVRWYKNPLPRNSLLSISQKTPLNTPEKIQQEARLSLFIPLTLEDRRSLIAALCVSMDHESKTTHECETPVVQEGPVETQDRGLFDFLGKKKEGEGTKQEEVMAGEFKEKVKVEECKEEEEKEKKHGLLEKLHRSGSSSSSSSDEEEGEDEEKKKKRKEKKDKKKKEEEKRHEEDTTVPVEKCEDPGAPAEDKKGLLDKIKEKLPGGQKKADEVPSPSPPPAECPAAEPPCHDGSPHTGSPKEKKGILEKIKEKLPGYHPKSDEEKEKE